MFLISELHLNHQKSKQLAARMRRDLQLAATIVPAESSGKSETGTTAGVAVFIDQTWHPVPVDQGFIKEAAR